jgi:hypothetical protein
MKVFCIGLSKTGTRSLHDALQLLGFRSMHWGGPELGTAVARGPEIRAAVERAEREGVPLLTYLDDVDAYSDILALSVRFEALDRQYQDSRFILTTRPLDDWLDSRRRHVEENVARKARGESHGSLLVVDEDAWMRERQEHEVRVHTYFADRPEALLTMDVSASDGWDVLCSFLGVPVPDAPFPTRR